MIKTIAVIEGDDAAPEAMKPVIALLRSLNIGLEWVYPVVGEASEATTGSTFPDDARALIDNADTTFSDRRAVNLALLSCTYDGARKLSPTFVLVDI